jgi:hypothetical protein
MDAMDARQAITAEYDRMMASYQRKEVRALYRTQTTEDYTMKQGDGSVLNREAVEANVDKEMAWVKSVPAMKIQIQNLAVSDETAVATVRIDATAIVIHPADPNRAEHTLTRQNTAHHTWIKTATGWKMKAAEVLSEDGQMDGQPFSPTVPR